MKRHFVHDAVESLDISEIRRLLASEEADDVTLSHRQGLTPFEAAHSLLFKYEFDDDELAQLFDVLDVLKPRP